MKNDLAQVTQIVVEAFSHPFSILHFLQRALACNEVTSCKKWRIENGELRMFLANHCTNLAVSI